MNDVKGSVIWFSPSKGFGFIQDEATQKEYFCHFSAILCNGYKTLNAEDRVEFDVEIGKQSGKEQAANVVVID